MLETEEKETKVFIYIPVSWQQKTMVLLSSCRLAAHFVHTDIKHAFQMLGPLKHAINFYINLGAKSISSINKTVYVVSLGSSGQS